MKQQITIKTEHGLCNRLRTIYPFLEYCENHNYTLNVVWPINRYCESSYHSVLQIPNNLNFIDERNTDHIDFCGFAAPKNILDLLSLDNHNYYKFFNPTKTIKELVIKYLQKISSQYNAVHIRRTDHIHLAQKKNRFTKDSIFEKFISDSPIPVYLATDCHITQTKFFQYFGSKIFIHKPIQKNKRLRQTSLEHSVLDIVMCSMSNNFLGSGYSSFSDWINCLKINKNNIPFYAQLR